MSRLLSGCFRKRASYRRRHRLHHFFARRRIPRRLRACHPLFTCLGQRTASVTRPARRGSMAARSTGRMPARQGPSHLCHAFCTIDNVTTKLLLLLKMTGVVFPLSNIPRGCIIVSNRQCASRGLIRTGTLRTLRGTDFASRSLDGLLFRRWCGGIVGASVLVYVHDLYLFSLLVYLPTFMRTRRELRVTSLFDGCNRRGSIAEMRLGNDVLGSCHVAACGDLIFGGMSPCHQRVRRTVMRSGRSGTGGTRRMVRDNILHDTCCRLGRIRHGKGGLGHCVVFGVKGSSVNALVCVRNLLDRGRVVSVLCGSRWRWGRCAV